MNETEPKGFDGDAFESGDLGERHRSERLQAALYRIAETSTTVEKMEDLYAAVHAIVGELVYARNFYVALYDSASDSLGFPYFVDEVDAAPPPIRPGKSLTEYVLRTGLPLLASPEVFARLVAEQEIELIGAASVDWLGVPLKRGEETFGVLGMQSYTEDVRFTPADLDLLTFVAQHVATAIDRRRAAGALRESEARFRTLADTTAVAIFIHDGTAFRYANDVMALMSGHRKEELLGLAFSDLVHPDFRNLVRERAMTLDGPEGIPARCEFKIVRKDGAERWLDLSAGLIEFGGRTAALATALDVTAGKQAAEEIRSLAYRDPLTGLPNRQLFMDRLSLAIAQAPRLKKGVALLFLDLDRLKTVNDSLGHVAGDQLLRAVGQRLLRALREGDTGARLGGDEFAVLAPGITSMDDAAKIAQKLQEALREPLAIEGTELFVSVSMGISLYPGDGEEAETLLTNASTAMYRAKEAGRDGFQPYDDTLKARAIERLALENGLRRAIANGELSVYYQPIADLRTGRVGGVEALLRWNHPARGFVSPAIFIELAELTGLILSIGEWALRTACAEIQGLRKRGRSDLRVAVNLSPRQFQNPRLVDEVRTALSESGLDARALELEITETAAMQDTEATIATIRRLQELGVRISLDDFGTGHSSLSNLRRFPIDTLKIDQSFVRDIGSDPQATAIVATIISMARSLRLRVLAEGVETEAQRDFLRDYGCDEMQGYLLARPMPLDALEKALPPEDR